MHFEYIAQLNEDQIFFTAKLKLIHVHASELISGEFEVLAVICQLLPVRLALSVAALECCYLASILWDTLPSTLQASFPLQKSEIRSARFQRLHST